MNEFTINLQLFGEDDGFEDFIPESTEVVDTAEPQAEIEQQTEGETETPTEEPKQEPTEQKADVPKVKLKYNHEEKEYSLDDVVPLAQKGLNYDKAVERAKQEAIDQYIANQGYEWNGKAITTEAEYRQAVYEKQLVDNGIDPETIKKGIEEHPTVKQAREIAIKNAEQEHAMLELQEFEREYPGVDVRTLDKSILEYRRITGKSITQAMMWHENQKLKSELQVLKQNAQNAKKAPVAGVTTHGGADTTKKDAFLEGFDED